MNKRKIYSFIIAVVVTVGIIASQVASVGAECIRNCPTPDAIIITALPPAE